METQDQLGCRVRSSGTFFGLKRCVFVGGIHHGCVAHVKLPVYSNTGGFGNREIENNDGLTDGYRIESLFLLDGSLMNFLRHETMSVREAAEQFYELTVSRCKSLS